MFWRKAKEINKLLQENNDLEEKLDYLIGEQEEREKYIKILEAKNHKMVLENEKLSNAIREYGDLQINNINIPYYIDKKIRKQHWFSQEKNVEITEVTKIIPRIEVHYVKEA